MELLGWLLFGGLIGFWAATKKGFSPVGGAIAGAALGPVGAFLLFLVSGLTPGDRKKKCVHCQTWIPMAATVCAQCKRDQPRVGVAAGA